MPEGVSSKEDIARRLASLHLEGLPLDTERRIREALVARAGERPPRGAVERDAERAERRRAFLQMLWDWHRRQLLMAAEGSIPVMDATRTKPDSRAPRDAARKLRELEREWHVARSNERRKQVLEDLQQLHRDLVLPKQDPSLRPKTQEWRRKIAHDPRPSRTVGRIYGVSHTEVLRYRAEFAGEPSPSE